MVRVRTSQKFFTEDEVTNITGICVNHLQTLARNKHLGTVVRAAESAGAQAEKWLFSHSDLMILTVIHAGTTTAAASLAGRACRLANAVWYLCAASSAALLAAMPSISCCYPFEF